MTLFKHPPRQTWSRGCCRVIVKRGVGVGACVCVSVMATVHLLRGWWTVNRVVPAHGKPSLMLLNGRPRVTILIRLSAAPSRPRIRLHLLMLRALTVGASVFRLGFFFCCVSVCTVIFKECSSPLSGSSPPHLHSHSLPNGSIAENGPCVCFFSVPAGCRKKEKQKSHTDCPSRSNQLPCETLWIPESSHGFFIFFFFWRELDESHSSWKCPHLYFILLRPEMLYRIFLWAWRYIRSVLNTQRCRISFFLSFFF